MTTWLNTCFEMRFRVIDGLTVRYAQSEDHSDHALLLSHWPESLLAFELLWPAPLAWRQHGDPGRNTAGRMSQRARQMRTRQR